MPPVLRGHPAFRNVREILRLPEPQVTPMPGVHREPHIAMMKHLLRIIRDFRERLSREAAVPPPPFKASKGVGKIMYGLWYGRITVEEAGELADELGISEESLTAMIAEATKPPSFWSRERAKEESDRGLGDL